MFFQKASTLPRKLYRFHKTYYKLAWNSSHCPPNLQIFSFPALNIFSLAQIKRYLSSNCAQLMQIQRDYNSETPILNRISTADSSLIHIHIISNSFQECHCRFCVQISTEQIYFHWLCKIKNAFHLASQQRGKQSTGSERKMDIAQIHTNHQFIFTSYRRRWEHLQGRKPKKRNALNAAAAAAHQRARTFKLSCRAWAGWPKRKAEKEAPLSVCGHRRKANLQKRTKAPSKERWQQKINLYVYIYIFIYNQDGWRCAQHKATKAETNENFNQRNGVTHFFNDFAVYPSTCVLTYTIRCPVSLLCYLCSLALALCSETYSVLLHWATVKQLPSKPLDYEPRAAKCCQLAGCRHSTHCNCCCSSIDAVIITIVDSCIWMHTVLVEKIAFKLLSLAELREMYLWKSFPYIYQLNHVMLWANVMVVMLSCVMLCYVTLCLVMLCYSMLCDLCYVPANANALTFSEFYGHTQTYICTYSSDKKWHETDLFYWKLLTIFIKKFQYIFFVK